MLPLFAEPQTAATTDDRYTPAWIFETMRLEFDLDVAAPPEGVPWIPARRYYTKADDGLAHGWEGLVWCNPPFSEPAPWVERWTSHPDGVWLGPCSNGRWVTKIMRSADWIWFADSPIHFISPAGVPEGIPVRTFMAARGQGAIGLKRLVVAAGGVLLREG